jgi:hypothetical protein
MRQIPSLAKKSEYNARYVAKCKKDGRYLDALQRKSVKSVEVFYPGCAFSDRMSRAEFDRHPEKAFPAGTCVRVGSTTWTIQGGTK